MRMGQEVVVLKAPHDDAWMDFSLPSEGFDLVGEENTMSGNEPLEPGMRNERIARENVRFQLAIAFLA